MLGVDLGPSEIRRDFRVKPEVGIYPFGFESVMKSGHFTKAGNPEEVVRALEMDVNAAKMEKSKR
jgi:hypothetical protein